MVKLKKMGLISSVACALAATTAAHAAVVSYAFDPGSFFDVVGYAPDYQYIVTGSFDYDSTAQTVATSGVDFFDSARDVTFDSTNVTVNSPTELTFDVGGNPLTFDFANSLASGGIDTITGGSCCGFTIAAGGSVSANSAVPEPATWALMLTGFGLVGYAMRKSARVRRSVTFA